MQLKLFVVMYLPVGVIIVSLIFFGQVLTAAPAAEEQTDIELEDKDTKQESEPSETEEIKEEDNTGKQEEEGKEEEQQSNDDTTGTGLEEDNITIGDNYSSNDDVPFDLPFDNIIPFP
jgi:Tfp pilus assembly protein PilN